MFSLLMVNCSSIQSNQNIIKAHDFSIENKEFLNLILEAKQDFKNKYNEFPNIIVIDFIGEKDIKIVDIISKSYLYFNEGEEDIIDERFEGISKINNTYVLLKNYKKHSKYNFIKFKNEKLSYEIAYGSFMNCCSHSFSYDGKFTLIESFCAPDF
ncbi:MAG: hypothetical protein ACK4M4_07665 [Flavobacterium sp.]